MEIEFKEEGIAELAGYFSQLAILISDQAREFVEEATAHIATRAEVNAPIWKYRLRPAIQTVPVQPVADGWDGGVLVPEHIHWASIMHEQLVSPMTPNPLYQLGPISRTMPGTLEGGVGGKFITRVVEVHKLQYQDHLAKAVQNLLRTRKVTRKFNFQP